MAFEIKKAKRVQRKFKAALNGPSGSGKTWTALELATGLIREGRILVIDSERSSSTLYAEKFDFDILDLPDTNFDTYLSAIQVAIDQKYEAIIIDSLSHAWEDLVEEADQIARKDRSKNSFTAWAEVTPIYKKLVKAIVDAPAHVLATMRTKTDYVMEEYTDSQGRKKTKPVKVGLAPIFRQGGEYEFDVVANIDLEHNFSVEKTRIQFLDGFFEKKINKEVGIKIRDWLDGGEVEQPIEPETNPLEYVVRTQGSKMCGKSLQQVISEPEGATWIKAVQSDQRYQAKLVKRDVVNILAITLKEAA